MRRRLFGPENDDFAASQCRLAAMVSQQGRHEEAEPLFRESLAMIKKLRGDTHPDMSHVLKNFAFAKFDQGKWDDAEALYRELLAIQRRLLGNDHRSVADTLTALAAILVNKGKHAQAEPFGREALAIFRKVRPGDHPEVSYAMHHLGMALAGQARLEEAAGLLREALTMQRKLFRPDDGALRQSLRNLGRILIGQQKLAEAEVVIRERVELYRSMGKPDSLIQSLQNLADVLYRQGKPGEAESVYRESLQILNAQTPRDEDDIAATSASLGRLLADWAWAERTNLVAADVRRLISKSEARSSKSELDQSLRTSAATGPVDRAREAEQILRECLAARLQRTNATPWRTSELKSRLGAALVSVAVTDAELTAKGRAAKLAEAEPLLLEGQEAVQQHPAAERQYKRNALERLVRLYEAWDKPDHAAQWRTSLDVFNETTSAPQPVP
jgi:tetratricopeptide (TPR) repeat protein